VSKAAVLARVYEGDNFTPQSDAQVLTRAEQRVPLHRSRAVEMQAWPLTPTVKG
jgi:hypothetical protein